MILMIKQIIVWCRAETIPEWGASPLHAHCLDASNSLTVHFFFCQWKETKVSWCKYEVKMAVVTPTVLPLNLDL